MNIQELPGLSVRIDRVAYLAERTAHPERPHAFVYFITILNNSEEAVTIKGRKWVVREANGETIAVEGDGVVGEFPYLEPGESFSYNSSHAVAGDAMAEGAYLGVTDSGVAVFTRIPRFSLQVPEE